MLSFPRPSWAQPLEVRCARCRAVVDLPESVIGAGLIPYCSSACLQPVEPAPAPRRP